MTGAPPGQPPGLRPVRRVLVANRGEIALRIARTVTARGGSWVAVFAADDAGAPHVRSADRSVRVTGYLDAGALVAAALSTGCDAVHPGYGFLSEDAGFARAVVDAGLVWVGPPPDVIERMGDKLRAKEVAEAAGVPVVPGAGRPGMDDAELAAVALAEVGLPLLVKPAAGGGGKGMRRVERAEDLPGALASARREAAGAFGDDTLLVERLVPRPRHIEIQVFADTHGGLVHLGTRECSLQRRHQKIVEETPSLALDDAARQAMAADALGVARAVGYVGAGTVEFVVPADRPAERYFLEMNTRLQVEHPVTEAVTGLDLVDWQLRVAAGERLPLDQSEIHRHGHAIEARVYAEDPARGFLPTGGRVLRLRQPAGRPGIRIDSGLAPELEVGSRFDPMLAKVVAVGEDRPQALDRLRAALRATCILGVTTNVAYLAGLLSLPEVVVGDLDTTVVGRTVGEWATGADGADGADEAQACAALVLLSSSRREPDRLGAAAGGPWDLTDGWRLSGRTGETAVGMVADGQLVTSVVRGGPAEWTVAVGDRPARAVGLEWLEPIGEGGGRVALSAGGVTGHWDVALDAGAVWVGRGGRTWRFAAVDRGAGRQRAGGGAGGLLVSPMPGVVAAVHVAAGDRVAAGTVLVAVEAMKMEHPVRATVAGTVGEVMVRVGQRVALDEPLVEVRVVGGPAIATTDREASP